MHETSFTLPLFYTKLQAGKLQNFTFKNPRKLSSTTSINICLEFELECTTFDAAGPNANTSKPRAGFAFLMLVTTEVI